MKKLGNLRKVSDYLQNFGIFDIDCSWHYVTAQADATTALDKAFGDQVLFARPEMRETATESDGHTDYIDTALFVLTRSLGSGRTQEKENVIFGRLLAIADAVMGKMDADINGGSCDSLAGFVITDIQISPVTSVFGGWMGWSIDISIEKR